MLKPIIKSGDELTKAELIRLNEILRMSYRPLPSNHIEEAHIKRTNPLFYLFKREGKILAFQTFNFFNKKTPFAKKALPIIHLTLSFRDPQATRYTKNFARESNLHFIRKKLGRFWFTKKFLVSFTTYNPKLYNRAARSFHTVYPRYDQVVPDAVFRFAKEYLKNELKKNTSHISHKLVVSQSRSVEQNITTVWASTYQSRDPLLNDFFIKEEVVSQRGDQYFVSNKSVMSLCYYSFAGMIKLWIKNQ